MFGDVIEQVDNNLMVMQICEEVAPKYGLRCLLAEKPFAGINGSGKHNNWSIWTTEGVPLLDAERCTKEMGGDAAVFPIVMSCVISALDEYGDMLRMAIATPGNEYRLGAMEAPPAIISTHLGSSLTQYLGKFLQMGDNVIPYQEMCKELSLGVSYLPKVHAPAEDRNRTSPFPYGGHRFEFRAVGSSQNVSMVNTVLSAIVAMEMSKMSERIEKGEKPVAVAQSMLRTHMRVIFNGNGYAESWPQEAEKRGLFNISDSHEAISCLTKTKNVNMLTKMRVLNAEECSSRKFIFLEQYINTVQEEIYCLIDMLQRFVLPSIKRAGLSAADVEYVETAVVRLRTGIDDIVTREHEAETEHISVTSEELDIIVPLIGVDTSGNSATRRSVKVQYGDFTEMDVSRPGMQRYSSKLEDNPGIRSRGVFEFCPDLDKAADLAREIRLELMREVRQYVDTLEEKIPADVWMLPTYEQLLFLDQSTS